MIIVETYMRLILPKLGINMVDAPVRHNDHFNRGE